MCIYCEKRKDIKFGWDQPALYDKNWNHPVVPDRIVSNLSLDESSWKVVVHDYQTHTPQLVLTSQDIGQALFGDGTATVNIPIKYCPACGRKLGSREKMPDKLAETIVTALTIGLEVKIPAISITLSNMSDFDKVISDTENEINNGAADINAYIKKTHMSAVYEISTYCDTQGLLRIYGYQLNNLMFDPEMFQIPEIVSVYAVDSFAACRLRYSVILIKKYFDENTHAFNNLLQLPEIKIKKKRFSKKDDQEWTTLTCGNEGIVNKTEQKRLISGTKYEMYNTCQRIALRLKAKCQEKQIDTMPKVKDIKLL